MRSVKPGRRLISRKKIWRAIRKDPTARSLLLSNLSVMGLALAQGWSLATVMCVYWWQSILIGVFAAVRMLTLPVDGLKIRGGADLQKQAGCAKVGIAGFFCFHYGFFHFGYYQFLRDSFKEADSSFVLVSVLIFFLNHLYSYLHSRNEPQQITDIGRLFTDPYARIMPMHLTIIFGFGFIMMVRNPLTETVVMIFFLTLKTAADLQMHVNKHALGAALQVP